MVDKPFEFKKFTVRQERCAMKVGTDGVLLGAWVALNEHIESILDIGTGTGLIALMLAQRSNAETIDAIEIDEAAYEQSFENFETSSWGDRLFCYHADLEEFAGEWDDTYDLIVCNPPFYSEDVSSGNRSRDMARQNASLPFEVLLTEVVSLLSKDGHFATIIPFKAEEDFLALALKVGLYPQRITRVKGNPKVKVKRSLLQFGWTPIEAETDELTIEIERHQYTSEYKSLTQDFYAKM